MVLFRIVILDLLHICVMFFIRFRHNRNVLLINLGVLCGGKGLCFSFEVIKKRSWRKIKIFRIYMCMTI